jgi:hypothetical protein
LFHRASKGKGKGRGTGKGKNKDAGSTTITDVNATVSDNPSSDATGEVDLSMYKISFESWT